MNLVSRNKNVMNHKSDLETLHILEKFPVFMRCVEHDISEDIFVDMHWSISKSNGVIQLNNLIPLDVLYQADHEAGVVGGIWLKY